MFWPTPTVKHKTRLKPPSGPEAGWQEIGRDALRRIHVEVLKERISHRQIEIEKLLAEQEADKAAINEGRFW